MFTELSPNIKFVVFWYGCCSWQSRCYSVYFFINLNLLKLTLFELIIMIRHVFKSLKPCPINITLIWKGNCKKCTTTNLYYEFVFWKNILFINRFFLHFDLKLEFFLIKEILCRVYMMGGTGDLVTDELRVLGFLIP